MMPESSRENSSRFSLLKSEKLMCLKLIFVFNSLENFLVIFFASQFCPAGVSIKIKAATIRRRITNRERHNIFQKFLQGQAFK